MSKIKIPNLKSAAYIFVILSLMVGFLPVTTGAQSLQELQRRIDRINSEISQSEDQIRELRQRENTLKNRLELLKAEQAQVRAEMRSTQDKIDRTKAQIEETTRELERTRQLIQQNVKVLYKQGNPSTLEILFSSKNFTDFISRQEYLDRVKKNLNEAARAAVLLKEALEEEEFQLNSLMLELEGQSATLAAKREEQQRLIDETRGEEARYQQMVADQRAERERLENQQREAYAAAAARAHRQGQFVVTGGTGSYPWAHKPYPCWTWDCADPWDLFYRECVSYTAWKVADTGRFVPRFNGEGHANQWPSTTSRHGIPNGTTPKAGSVAIIMNIGAYGHSMYVEEVLSGNRIRISEYNFAGPGMYSERIISADGLIYIYF